MNNNNVLAVFRYATNKLDNFAVKKKHQLVQCVLIVQLLLVSPLSFAATYVIDTSANAPITGLWWNVDESGWGVTLTQQVDIIFVTIFTYDQNGLPIWYVASNCSVSGPGCSGELYFVEGGSSLTEPWDDSELEVKSVGNIEFVFSDDDNGRLVFEIEGTSGSKDIIRQVFSPSSHHARFSSLWWNANESGWGTTVIQQSDISFITSFTFDQYGSPTWYVASSCTVINRSCSGEFYEVTGGSALTDPWDGSNLTVTEVGNVDVSLTGDDEGSLNFLIDGIEGTKDITRQIFALDNDADGISDNFDDTKDGGSDIVGTWAVEENAGEEGIHIVLTFNKDHTFSLSESLDSPGEGEINGVESGSYEWDANSGNFNFTIMSDGNGVFGFSDEVTDLSITLSNNRESIVVSGDVNWILTAKDPSITGSWSIIEDAGDEGAWMLTLSFLENGSFTVDESLSQLNPDLAENNNETIGVEHGTYLWEKGSGLLSFTITEDNNGTFGFSNAESVFIALAADNQSITVRFNGLDGLNSTWILTSGKNYRCEDRRSTFSLSQEALSDIETTLESINGTLRNKIGFDSPVCGGGVDPVFPGHTPIIVNNGLRAIAVNLRVSFDTIDDIGLDIVKDLEDGVVCINPLEQKLLTDRCTVDNRGFSAQIHEYYVESAGYLE